MRYSKVHVMISVLMFHYWATLAARPTGKHGVIAAKLRSMLESFPFKAAVVLSTISSSDCLGLCAKRLLDL